LSVGSTVTSVMKNTLLNRGFKTSPDYTAYVSGSIGTASGTPVAADTALGAVVASWNGGTNFKDYEPNFPSFDEPNLRVSTRMLVTASQGNGNTIAEYADFNKDTPIRIGGRFVFNGIVKTTAIQVFFTPTYRFT